MLLLFTPFVYSQESIGFDKFRLGMNKSDIMDIIYSNYQGWRLSKLDTALPTYDLIRDDTYSILLSFHSDDTLRGIGIHQRFDDIKSARVENKRLVDI